MDLGKRLSSPCLLATATWLAATAALAGTATREWNAMGTRMRLSVRGEGAELAATAMAAAAQEAVEAVEAATSSFRAGNAVARAAESAGSGEWISTNPIFDETLQTALDTAETTDGAFNPLVGSLMERLGFPRRPEGIPLPPEDSPLLDGVLDWRRIERRPGACRLPVAGMRLDFGGLAKGIGADRAAEAVRSVATNDFLLDAGGTLVCRGIWSVGLRNPRDESNQPFLRVFTLAEGMACATSGNYERFAMTPDGQRIGHLVDPRSALPADGGENVLQATALARNATSADAWSTALFVLGPEAGQTILERCGIPMAAAWVLGKADGDDLEVICWPASGTAR